MPAVEYFNEQNNQQYFDTVVFSCVEKTVKPDEKIFRIALDRLGLQPQEVVFIDDKIENIRAARQIQMNGIVYENIEQVKEKLSKKLKIIV